MNGPYVQSEEIPPDLVQPVLGSLSGGNLFDKCVLSVTKSNDSFSNLIWGSFVLCSSFRLLWIWQP